MIQPMIGKVDLQNAPAFGTGYSNERSLTTVSHGRWVGDYPSGPEVVEIQQIGPILQAVKVFGNEYVPAGAVTWRVFLGNMTGEGRIGDRETRVMRFVPGFITIVNRDRIRFTWERAEEDSQPTVTFIREDA